MTEEQSVRGKDEPKRAAVEPEADSRQREERGGALGQVMLAESGGGRRLAAGCWGSREEGGDGERDGVGPPGIGRWAHGYGRRDRATWGGWWS
jgi:hypothetical protein